MPRPIRLRRAGALRLAALGLIALAFAAGPSHAQEGGGQPMPMAVAVSADRGGANPRLAFDLSRSVDAVATVVEGPDRVIVDLPQVDFQIDPAAGRPKPDAAALIRSFRFGLLAPGRSRIVIDLGGPATVTRVGSAPIAEGDPARLTIELARTDRASFHRAALATAEVRPAAIVPAAATDTAAADPAQPVVVIDPGHGGIDPGASGLDGTVEKAVVFDFATALRDKLQATGRYRVVMTRSGDSFVSLADRVRIARDSKAALLVSVHADTLSVSGGVTGATVYTASDRASDAAAARVAESENRADSAAGVVAAPEPADVDDILFDLTRRETRTYAHLFQRTLVGYWQKIARLNKNPERAAGFRVLQAPDVPSVLLELGYLSSDKDVRSLTSPAWRDGATASVVGAIDAFFAPRRDPAAVVTAAPAAAGTAAN